MQRTADWLLLALMVLVGIIAFEYADYHRYIPLRPDASFVLDTRTGHVYASKIQELP